MWIYPVLLIGIVSTLIIELAIALICKVSKKDLPIVALANILTNPLVVLLFYSFRYQLPQTLLIIVLEISAVLAEWLIYKHKTSIKRPALIALLANAISYSVGFLIF